MKELFNSDTAVGRGVRTFIQVVIAVIVAVWKVPGVPDVIYKTIQDSAIVTVPAIAGVVAVIWNALRRDVPNV